MLACITASLCIACIAAVTSSAAAEVAEFQSSNAEAAVAAQLSVPARSDIECATLCTRSRSFTCRAFEFKEDTQSCEMRDTDDAGFVKKPDNTEQYVTRGSRTFLVIQQRLRGDVDFNRSWTEYENGFGNDVDFWIGLKAIRNLTKNGSLLRVEVTRWSGDVYVTEYLDFTVGDASTEYTMTFTSAININMTMSDGYSLGYNKGRKFSTHDNDNDAKSENCAAKGAGGWWLHSCTYSNVNGRYSSSETSDADYGMLWHGAGGTYNTVQRSRLLLQVREYDNVTVTRGSRKFRVIQQRLQGHVNFSRPWAEYEVGFGDNTDFWIGLQAIAALTQSGSVLRVEVTRWNGSVYVCEYSGFTVSDASTKYTMTYTTFTNTNMTEDSMTSHKNMKFSTFDNDNDSGSENCAADPDAGGFWFWSCARVNPNGRYSSSAVYFGNDGMMWNGAGGTHDTVKEVRMMLQV